MWAREDVCELFAQNVSPFAENLGPRAVLFAANVGRVEQRLWASRITFVGRYSYVDNNSAPTIASNLLETNAVLSWQASGQRAKRFRPLLCATISRTPACYARQGLLSAAHSGAE